MPASFANFQHPSPLKASTKLLQLAAIPACVAVGLAGSAPFVVVGAGEDVEPMPMQYEYVGLGTAEVVVAAGGALVVVGLPSPLTPTQ